MRQKKFVAISITSDLFSCQDVVKPSRATAFLRNVRKNYAQLIDQELQKHQREVMKHDFPIRSMHPFHLKEWRKIFHEKYPLKVEMQTVYLYV